MYVMFVSTKYGVLTIFYAGRFS